MLIYCNGPKVGIKLIKITHVRILFLVLNQVHASLWPTHNWFLEIALSMM